MKVRDVPGFPYRDLVRFPLIGVSSLALYLVVRPFLSLYYEVDSALQFFVAGNLLMSLIFALFAVPNGILAIKRSRAFSSVPHLLALFCALIYLGAAALLIVTLLFGKFWLR